MGAIFVGKLYFYEERGVAPGSYPRAYWTSGSMGLFV